MEIEIVCVYQRTQFELRLVERSHSVAQSFHWRDTL